jgi:hypothetical protein
LGRFTNQPEGVLVLRTEKVGLSGHAPEIAYPLGLKVFVAGTTYFHEGLSLQESVVPVVTWTMQGAGTTEPSARLRFEYKNKSFKNSAIGVKLINEVMEDARVMIRIVDSTNKSKDVGDLGDFDELNPSTREVLLQAAGVLTVPVLIRPKTPENITIQALSLAGVILAELKLKNEMEQWD